MPGYARQIGRYLETRLMNRVESPDELLENIAAALTRKHGLVVYEYEERYVKIHHPYRHCPVCDDVVRMQVVVNTDIEKRTRHCPECSETFADHHTKPERFEMMADAGLPRGVGLQAHPGGAD